MRVGHRCNDFAGGDWVFIWSEPTLIIFIVPNPVTENKAK